MEIKWIYGKTEDFKKCHAVRKAVFVDEQGFDLLLEFDEIDERAYHLIITDEKKAIATARIFSDSTNNKNIICGRICIISEYRGVGLGKTLMNEIETKAMALEVETISISAQITACGFYEKMGFTVFGQEYLDEFCPHIGMKKVILQ